MRIVNAALKRALRAKAHALKPVVIVADRGLDETVVEETRRALERHELIKVRIRRERDERSELAQSLCEQTGSALIQSIGQIVCIYRPRPESSGSESRGKEGKRPESKRDNSTRGGPSRSQPHSRSQPWGSAKQRKRCLLYTSDAADE